MARADVRWQQDGWAVIIEAKEPPQSFDRQRDAEVVARKLVQGRGGGEVIIHGRDGRILEKRSVPKRKAYASWS